jgi:hypothetical protein
MNTITLALAGTWKVLLVSLLLGAGLPAVFALGMRSLAWGAGGDAEVSHARPHPAGRALAIVCFTVVVVGIVLGITYIVASGLGMKLSFEHIYPRLVSKH